MRKGTRRSTTPAAVLPDTGGGGRGCGGARLVEGRAEGRADDEADAGTRLGPAHHLAQHLRARGAGVRRRCDGRRGATGGRRRQGRTPCGSNSSVAYRRNTVFCSASHTPCAAGAGPRAGGVRADERRAAEGRGGGGCLVASTAHRENAQHQVQPQRARVAVAAVHPGGAEGDDQGALKREAEHEQRLAAKPAGRPVQLSAAAAQRATGPQGCARSTRRSVISGTTSETAATVRGYAPKMAPRIQPPRGACSSSSRRGSTGASMEVRQPERKTEAQTAASRGRLLRFSSGGPGRGAMSPRLALLMAATWHARWSRSGAAAAAGRLSNKR